MVGPGDYPPLTDSQKLDRLIAQMSKIDSLEAQVATVIKRLDSHDWRIARTEKFQTGTKDPDTPESECPGGSSGGGGGGGGDGGSGFGDGFLRGHGGPRELKLTFPRFDGESDPLPWLNKCD
jgi:hypothetical protein